MPIWSYKGHTGSIFILTGLFLVLSASSTFAEASVLFGRKPAVNEISAAHIILRTAFANRDDMPDKQPIIEAEESYLWWNSRRPDRRMLVVARVNFRSLANSYCRLVTLASNLKEATLIPLPAQANYDDCKSASRPMFVDLNQDNIDDVVYKVEVKSNRYSQNAMVPMVYLSDPKFTSGYCYAAGLSDKVELQDLDNAKNLQSRIKEEVERLGRGILQCRMRWSH